MNVKNKDITYTMNGSGETIILLHGWGLTSEAMKEVEEHLVKKYRVINFDLPGFGVNELDKPWHLDDYVECLKMICEKENVAEPVLVAHSFGGRIALKFAGCYKVKKMILTGCAGICPKRTLKYYLSIHSYKLKKKLHISTKNMGSSDYQNAHGFLRETLVHVLNEDLSPLLSEIEVPVLLIWGDKDEATPLYMGEIMQEQMKDARLFVFENDDHFAYLHQMTRFISLVNSFLEL